MIGAIALYGGSSIPWVWILTGVPLSIASLFGALAFVLMPLCAAYLFRETLDAKFAVGAALILCGVIIITR